MAGVIEDQPFTLEKPRYDLSAYSGRVKQMYQQTNPKYLFVSKGRADEAKKLLDDYAEGTAPAGTTDAELWEARAIREAVFHPETGEQIFPLFRFCAFSPSNVVIATTMLNPTVIASPILTLGVHWANQSYNAAINYANRNASNPISTETLAKAYTGAVLSSCTIALGATYLTKKAANLSAAVKTLIRSTLPFAAVAAAGFANVSLIRGVEITDGVDLIDDEGVIRGRSPAAGKLGITECGLARVLWNIPIMVFPPVIMSQLEKIRRVRTGSPGLKMCLEIGVIAGCLFTGVPPALAAFPQVETIEAAKVEPEFQNLRNSKGNIITQFTFNKGL
ncbi:hypothetical protein NDN08_001984 [Rhodosorus marinus]|uniref:Sidoreflexin n=1 Tax=Rhodosorus marinus TaxID=101924 RepID=A0AAV8UW37_9RHOD|nr:hypothetical protein NDN08_001984 [Rhodosorus marinus]